MLQERDIAKPSRRNHSLDFIRGLAILLVLDFHAPHSLLLRPFTALGWPHFGWAGVDIFFVLSGFLVGGLLIRERQLTGTFRPGRFLIRRGFKIWPQYYVFLFVMLAAGHRSFTELYGNFLNIQNYVGGVAHTWTLAVEEHSYIVLAIGVYLVVRTKAKTSSLLYSIVSLAASVLVWRFYLASKGYNTFTRTDTRIDGILYGFVLAIFYYHYPDIFRRLQRRFWPWLLLATAALIYFRFVPKHWWGAPLGLVFADGLGVSVLLLLFTDSRPAYAWPYRAIAWIGLYSYGIYIWHVSVIQPLVHVAAWLPASLQGMWTLLAPPIGGIGIGVLTSKLIEIPSLLLRDRLYPGVTSRPKVELPVK